MKRVFDFFLANLGIFLSLPFWLIFAFLIWLQDFGPVFYFQERVGRGGRLFKSLQFRSMVMDAEERVGPLQSVENDARVTPIGRFLRVTAMDELPQLFNIARGDMSFVGPRALRPVEIDMADGKERSIWDFEGAIERSKVRPGLTGVAQIYLKRDALRSEKFKYDLWYIRNRSFGLDIYLIIVSFIVTFSGKWESRQDKLRFIVDKKRILESNLKGQLS
jgi:lipopolysaccharide/colanic/teichoic acid biosynthesis glycosyltransferase